MPRVALFFLSFEGAKVLTFSDILRFFCNALYCYCYMYYKWLFLISSVVGNGCVLWIL